MNVAFALIGIQHVFMYGCNVFYCYVVLVYFILFEMCLLIFNDNFCFVCDFYKYDPKCFLAIAIGK